MVTGEVEILLVEDSSEDAELTIHALREKNLANRLHRVEDGAEALEFLFNEGEHAERAGMAPPRVVMLDLKLPRVDGLEVLRRLRADERTRDVPVVVMTSSREARDLQDAYALGANSYVVKPVDFAQFMEAVTELGIYWLMINEPPR